MIKNSMYYKDVRELPENQITKTLSPIDREDANGELEKGEVVFSPNKMTLHKVLGKPHSRGGTPVNLNTGDFIFSNFKGLAFDKNDVEEMEFKEGGRFGKKANYTPARVIQREVAGGIEHHNKMVNILNKPAGFDTISQQSANLMLEKNMEKIGQVAYKQEEKKAFREGIPEISIGSAPVFDPQLEEDMKKAKQYNPYQSKNEYQAGGIFNAADWYKKNQAFVQNYDPNFFMGVDLMQPAARGIYTKEQQPGLFNRYVGNANSVLGTQLGTDLNPNNITAYQQQVYNQAPEALDFFYNSKTPSIRYNNKKPQKAPETFIDGLFNRDGVQFSNLVGPSLDIIDRNAQAAGLVKKGDNYVFGSGQQATIFRPKVDIPRIDPSKFPQLNTPTPVIAPPEQTPQPQSNPIPTRTPTPEQPDLPFRSTRFNVGLTPWQQINMARDLAGAIGVQSYMPMRQQQQSVLTAPDLISAQPMINQINQGFNNASRLNRLQTNPQMALAANQQMAGQRLDQINQTIGQVQNQNVGILNQSQERNASILNRDAEANRAFDKQYHDQVTASLQNRDDMRDMRMNQFMDNANQTFSQNQAFNNALNSQQQFKTAIKDSSGKTIGYRGGLPYEPVKGFFGVGTRYNPDIDSKSLLEANIGFGQPQKDEYLNEAIALAFQKAKAGDKEGLRSLSYLLGQRGRSIR